MKRLHEAISEFVPAIKMGSNEPPPFKPEQVERKLRSVQKIDQRHFLICVAMVLVFYIACLVVLLGYRHNPTAFAAVFAVLGAATAGAIRTMLGLWRERAATDYLIALSGTLDEATLKVVLAVFLKRIK